MSTTIASPTRGAATTGLGDTPERAAARRMYEAEVALHAARQSRVDEWVAAATEKLHEAIVEHLAATSESRP
jgi:hypothetical protein